ncbi:MAG: hypothetical protein K2J49_08900, partial [Muribaculaceae bacterium]|nr:hypothetical protein [Muribaculaceae bacterium]
SEEVSKRYVEQARTLPVQWYYAAMRLLSDCDLNYRTATGKRLLVELTLIRLCQLLKPATPPFDSLDRPMPLGDPTAERKAASRETQPQAQPAPHPQAQPQVASHPHPQAQPASHPQPMQGATLAKSASTPAVKARQLSRPSTFRLSEPSHSVSANAGSLAQRSTPVTHERFMQGWGEFIARNPSLHILVNTMRGAHPEPNGENCYRIVVDHPAQLQAFELSMPKLLEFLRDFLSNDLLVLKVEVNTAPVGSKQLPPREFLRQVVSDNPAMARFLSDLNAELV